MATSQSCLRRENAYTPGLIESYCASCGLLVAASQNKAFLDVAETAHICPVYFHYPLPQRKQPQSASRNPQKGGRANRKT